MDSINELTEQYTDRVDLAEICCHPENELSWTCQAQGGKAMRLSIGTGYDLLTYDGTQSALSELVARAPRFSWFSTPCTPWCSWQRVNLANATEQERKRLARQQRKARKLYRNALYLAAQAIALG